MVEYVIELVEGDVVVALLHTERDGSHSRVKPSFDGYSHVRKYRVKERAQKIADKFPGARLAQTYGGYAYGTKTSVAPLQSKINKRPAYRSI